MSDTYKFDIEDIRDRLRDISALAEMAIDCVQVIADAIDTQTDKINELVDALNKLAGPRPPSPPSGPIPFRKPKRKSKHPNGAEAA
jgi:hypothetical protein